MWGPYAAGAARNAGRVENRSYLRKRVSRAKNWVPAFAGPSGRILANRVAPRRARHNHLGEIDRVLARHADTFELHLVGIERLGGVEPHLGADAVARRRIELRALALGHDHQIAVGLEARRHRPFDF